MKTLITITATLLTILFSTSINAQHKLTIDVSNLENSKGNLKVALFDSETNFMQKGCDGKIVKVEGTTAQVIFENLDKGEYAIILFQDENNNNTLDMGAMGIPTEKYGFSNDINPAEIKGKPSFSQCKFTVDEDTTVSIKAIRVIAE